MKINITNKQYRDLITMLGMANSIVGTLRDMTTIAEYRKTYARTEALEQYFTKYAKDFNCEDLLEEDKGEFYWKDEAYDEQIMSTIMRYDDFTTHSNLASKLAWRDFIRDHTEKQIDEMKKENDGYFGLEVHDYETRYWNEFEKHGYDRLEITNKE